MSTVHTKPELNWCRTSRESAKVWWSKNNWWGNLWGDETRWYHWVSGHSLSKNSDDYSEFATKIDNHELYNYSDNYTKYLTGAWNCSWHVTRLQVAVHCTHTQKFFRVIFRTSTGCCYTAAARKRHMVQYAREGFTIESASCVPEYN